MNDYKYFILEYYLVVMGYYESVLFSYPQGYLPWHNKINQGNFTAFDIIASDIIEYINENNNET